MISSVVRRHIYVRPLRMADEADKQAFIVAGEHTDRFYPPNIFSLPSTRVMVAEKREEHGLEKIAYMPTYTSLVLGSPIWLSTNELERASALHQFTAAAYTRANAEMFGDLVMFSNSLETESFSARHQYEKAHQAYRLDVR